jgi:hypothetical protein
MKEEATYKTAELARIFTYWQHQGYEAMNLKLITDLIERDAKERLPLNTVGRLKEELEQYKDDTVIWWQFYTDDHAFIYGDLWNGITEELLTNDEFQEDLHEFVNGWFDSAQRKIEELEEGIDN